jgi:hypothetical protein
MGINLVTYYNSTVTPQDDALIYENALPASGMIYGGNVTIKNANTLHVTAGHGALCGRKFTLEETDVPVILTSSGTLNGRLYIHMDLSDTGSPISLEVERAASLTPVIQQSNVNINDGIYEINLATFQISTSTISNLVYVAPFIKYEFAKEVIIAPVEKTSTASTAYAVGKHLIYNDILYRVTTAISSGGQINPGVNVVVSETIQNQIETNAGNISTANTNITNLSNNKANQTIIAPRQANATAATTYYAGDQFILNNVLYTATKTINSGTTINSGNSTASATIVSQISNIANWVLVDPIASISGSTGGSKPTFYKRGKELIMTTFPHPNTGATITMTFKSEYTFKGNMDFSLLNYSSWNKDYEVLLPYSLNAANRILTSDATTQFAYFRLLAPVIFPLA